MRSFSYITVGKILSELREEVKHKLPEDRLWEVDKKGKRKKKYPITRITFYRLEKKLQFPQWNTHEKNQWRTYSRQEAEIIKKKIKDKYKFFYLK